MHDHAYVYNYTPIGLYKTTQQHTYTHALVVWMSTQRMQHVVCCVANAVSADQLQPIRTIFINPMPVDDT